MTRPRPLTLLHLSDMQFGKEHRFAGHKLDADNPFDSLLARLKDDLDRLKNSAHRLQPDLVVCTGDLTEWGLRSEFDDLFRFLDGLGKHLGLPRERILLVPGNHDINRKACLAYFNECDAEEKTPREPFFPKWRFYVEFFERFYEGLPQYKFTAEEPYTFYELPALDVVVAGLNSTLKESHRDDDHYGFLGEPQLESFARRLRDYDERHLWRIAMVHHNLLRGATSDDENLRDTEDLTRILGAHLDLVVHGHTHEGKVHWLTPRLPVLSTGSAALGDRARPGGVPNQYEVIRLEPGQLWFGARGYAPDQKRFVGDNRVSPEGDVWYHEEPLPVRGQTHHGRSSSGTGNDNDNQPLGPPGGRITRRSTRDEFPDRVAAICRLREGAAQVERIAARPPLQAYLRVTKQIGQIVMVYPIGVAEHGVSPEILEAFVAQAGAIYRTSDASSPLTLVYGGAPATSELIREAARRRVHLVSFIEYQGLIDFRPYLERLEEQLGREMRYPPNLYVPQRVLLSISGRLEPRNDALAALGEYLAEPHGRFILVLGDAGVGKTFLLYQLGRQLAQAARQNGSPVPVLLEMRKLEKSHALDELVAQHLTQAGMERIDLAAFRYMLGEGRIALLIDGFDELALRARYEQAADHLGTVLQAAHGQAKIVLTSRTQHFESEHQVKTVLARRLDTLPGQRVVRLKPFDDEQIRIYLEKKFGDPAAAKARYELLAGIHDLLGLATNPRLLGFILDVPESDLRSAQARPGRITRARVYELVLEKWLQGEHERAHPRGAPPGLSVSQRWTAIVELARRLWPRSERALSVKELPAEIGRVLSSLAHDQLDVGEIAHQVGSGTLLVNDGQGNLSFIHQSVLEWLVARAAADDVERTGSSTLLLGRELSPLCAEFFAELAGREQALRWARTTLTAMPGDIPTANALKLTRHLDADMQNDMPERMDFAGRDLRGQDLANRNFAGADLRNADLSEADLRGADLSRAQLGGARLGRANLTDARLIDAHLERADLSFANLCGADLHGAHLEGARVQAVRLVGAHLDPDTLGAFADAGAAPPTPREAEPMVAASSGCRAIAISPDGSLLAAGHRDGTIRLWELATARLLRVFPGHRSTVWSVAFSPSGHTLASASDDHTVCLWQVASGWRMRTLTGHTGAVWSVAFSPDGHLLASASTDETVRLWRLPDGVHGATLTGHTSWVRAVCFSADSSLLCSASSDHTLRLWQMPDGEHLRTLEGHPGRVWTAAFSPDGTLLASGADDNSVRLWDSKSGQLLHILNGHQGWVQGVCFGAGGHLASVSADHHAMLWQLPGTTPLRTLSGHQERVYAVAFTPDGATLATGSDDWSVRLWEVPSGQLRHSLTGHESWVRGLAFSHDGRYLSSSSIDRSVRLWRLPLGKSHAALAGHEDHVWAVAFSPDGQTLASAAVDKTVRLWRLDHDETQPQALATVTGHHEWIWAIAFSRDGQILASAGDDIHLWSVPSGQHIRTLAGHTGWVRGLTFAPGADLLASAGDDKTVRLWEVSHSSRVRVLEGHTAELSSVCFSPDGAILASAGNDRTVRLWDVASGKLLRVLEGHGDWVWSISFSPDGRLIASASSDKTVRLWDFARGRLIRTLEDHTAGVMTVAFHPRGRHLASASYDGTIRLWEAASGQCIGVLVHFAEGWAVYTPTGRYRVGGDIGGGFWHVIGLCRFEPGELEPYLPMQMDDDEPLLLGV